MEDLRLRYLAVLAAAVFTTESCARTSHAQSSSAAQKPWRSLMTPSAWRGYKSDSIPSAWKFADGTLSKSRPVADIVSRDEFDNFELELEWKIGRAGNAGIFYRGTEEYDHIYWTAPEYQLLDNVEADDNKTPLTRAAAAYGLYPPPDGHVKPVGEWNLTKIVANRAHIEHWLNGTKVVEYELWSPDWLGKVKASKFNAWPNYGKAMRGHIALQGDHRGELAFRNIRIRELP